MFVNHLFFSFFLFCYYLYYQTNKKKKDKWDSNPYARVSKPKIPILSLNIRLPLNAIQTYEKRKDSDESDESDDRTNKIGKQKMRKENMMGAGVSPYMNNYANIQNNETTEMANLQSNNNDDSDDSTLMEQQRIHNMPANPIAGAAYHKHTNSRINDRDSDDDTIYQSKQKGF